MKFLVLPTFIAFVFSFGFGSCDSKQIQNKAEEGNISQEDMRAYSSCRIPNTTIEFKKIPIDSKSETFKVFLACGEELVSKDIDCPSTTGAFFGESEILSPRLPFKMVIYKCSGDSNWIDLFFDIPVEKIHKNTKSYIEFKSGKKIFISPMLEREPNTIIDFFNYNWYCENAYSFKFENIQYYIIHLDVPMNGSGQDWIDILIIPTEETALLLRNPEIYNHQVDDPCEYILNDFNKDGILDMFCLPGHQDARESDGRGMGAYKSHVYSLIENKWVKQPYFLIFPEGTNMDCVACPGKGEWGGDSLPKFPRDCIF